MKRKNIFRLLDYFFIAQLIYLMFNYTIVYAQRGAWISHQPVKPVNGTWYSDAGSSCVGAVPGNSQYIYFFDINNSRWTEIDLGSTQAFQDLKAEGETIIAFSDQILVGYSAILSQWDTLFFEGTLLSASGGIYQSWGCGDSLAYFVTDNKMYVFDSQQGSWQIHDYTLPTWYSGTGYYWVESDYVGALLYQAPPSYSFVMVYSSKSTPPGFNQQDLTGPYFHPNCGMTHGFITHWWSGTNNVLHAYSAINNQFTERIINAQLSGGTERVFENLLERTAAVYTHTEIISPTQWRTYFYGYDTRSGTWTDDNHNYNPNEWSGLGTFVNGGQISVASQVRSVPRATKFVLFDGRTGTFHHLYPAFNGGDLNYLVGGTVMVATELDSVWFYSVDGPHSTELPRIHPATQLYAGENFVVHAGYNYALDSSNVYFYHGTHHTWIHRTTWRTGNYRATPYLVGFSTGGINYNVYLYSGITGGLSIQDYSSGDYGIESKGNLALVRSSTLSCVYDANTNQLFRTNAFLSADINNKMGSIAALLQEVGNLHRYYAYSSHTGHWTEFIVPENILTCYNKCYIGLSHSGDAALHDVFYAYNGFYDNLVRLHPIGTRQSYGEKIGEKTALVIRDSMIYAFDPEGIGIDPIVITHRNSGINLTIPDFTTVSDTLYINSTDKIKSSSVLVGVSLLIDTVFHSNDGDLEFLLNHNGVTDTLIYHAGGNGSDFIGTQLNDEANNSINSGNAPFSGVYRPYNPLSAFNHLDPAGEWILSIYDAAAGNTGTLESWGLTLFFDVSSEIDHEQDLGVHKYFLAQNYPNPFNPMTNISFELPHTSKVRLNIYNILGQRVSTVVDKVLPAGKYSYSWKPENLASGVYIYQLETGSSRLVKKMILIK